MRFEQIVRWVGSAAAVAAVTVWLTAPVVWADDGGPQQQIDNLRETLVQLEEGAPEGVGDDDFAMARQWLDEAEERHSAGRSSGVEQRLRRVDHTLDLLRAQLEIARMERSTESQHEAYEQMREQIESLREDIESLERQRDERKRELERVKSDE